MSLWVDGENKNGKRSLYSIGADPFSVFASVILVGTMIFPLLAVLVQTLRNLFQ